MNKIYLILIISLLTKFSFSQQMPIFTNAFFSQQYNNPASMVINPYKRFSMNSSIAAAGFSDAPKSYLISYEHPFSFNKDENLPSYQLGKNIDLNNQDKAFGSYLMYDTYGAINQISAMVSYAQRFIINRNTFIAFGLSTGIYSYGLDYSKLTIKEKNDETYSMFLNNNSNLIYWDANFGFLVKYKNYKQELAIKQFIGDKAKLSSDDINAEIQISYYSNTSALFKINSDINIIPSIEFYKTTTLPYQLNIKLPFIYKGKWIASANYQHNRNIGLGIGFIYNFLAINYSFQYNTSQYSYIGNTNHELGIIMLLNTRRNIKFEEFF